MNVQFLLRSFLILSFGIGASAGAETAVEIMTSACKAFDGANSGRMKIHVSVDDDIVDDTKIQQNYIVDIQIKRPNKFRATTQGDHTAAVYFNGDVISAVDFGKNLYARRFLKGNIPELLAEAERMNIPTPMLDFFERQHCLDSLQVATSSTVLKDLMLNGQVVKHLAFRNDTDKIDWQVWVAEANGRRSIKKAVITSRYLTEQPQYQFTVLSEELDVRLDDDNFDFFAYEGLSRVPFLAELDENTEPMYRRPVARRTARRTTRRVVRRSYIRQLPAGCVYRSGTYRCGSVYYRAVLEDGVTVYIVVNP